MDHQPYEDDIFYDSLGMRVWERRHQFADEILRKYQCQKILDVGCSEGKFLQRLSRDPNNTFLAGLDISDETLATAVMTLQPEAIQAILTNQRTQRLTMNLYKGDATKKSQLLKTIGFDAITIIEMMEHIEKSQLAELSENIFGFMRVKLVIMTTPNADFNIYFKQKNPSFIYRHPDHRYEMTRQEFQEWGQEIARRYNYEVNFGGVVLHKSLDQTYGHCSQVAVFIKIDDDDMYLLPDDEPTRLYEKLQYPWDDRTLEQKVRDCLKYVNLSSECQEDEDYWIYDLPYNQIAISLSDLMYRCGDISDSTKFENVLMRMVNEKMQLIERNNKKYLQITLEDQDDCMEIEELSDLTLN